MSSRVPHCCVFHWWFRWDCVLHRWWQHFPSVSHRPFHEWICEGVFGKVAQLVELSVSCDGSRSKDMCPSHVPVSPRNKSRKISWNCDIIVDWGHINFHTVIEGVGSVIKSGGQFLLHSLKREKFTILLSIVYFLSWIRIPQDNYWSDICIRRKNWVR